MQDSIFVARPYVQLGVATGDAAMGTMAVLQHPDFVAIPGDIVYGAGRMLEYHKELLSLLQCGGRGYHPWRAVRNSVSADGQFFLLAEFIAH